MYIVELPSGQWVCRDRHRLHGDMMAFLSCSHSVEGAWLPPVLGHGGRGCLVSVDMLSSLCLSVRLLGFWERGSVTAVSWYQTLGFRTNSLLGPTPAASIALYPACLCGHGCEQKTFAGTCCLCRDRPLPDPTCPREVRWCGINGRELACPLP